MLRVSNVWKRVLDCLWIESRNEIAANGRVYLRVVTAMCVAVHYPCHGGDHPEANTSVSCIFYSRFDPQAV